MTTYTVALSKGGSTKTTTAAELVVALTRAGRRVGAIDLDQQGNLTTRLGIRQDAEVIGVASDVLEGKVSAKEAALPSLSVPGAEIIAGTNDLIDIDINRVPDLITCLRDHLAETGHNWDDIVIDTPPSLAPLTLAGLAAADVVVASMACEAESLEQIARLNEVIEAKIARRIRPGQRIHWIVPTKYDERRLLDREVVEEIHQRYPGMVTTPVREAVAVRDSYHMGQPISVYDPKSKPALDYAAALAPIIARSVGE